MYSNSNITKYLIGEYKLGKLDKLVEIGAQLLLKCFSVSAIVMEYPNY